MTCAAVTPESPCSLYLSSRAQAELNWSFPVLEPLGRHLLSTTMLFHFVLTLAIATRASAYYFFPAAQDSVGQTPLGLTPPWRPPKHWPVRSTLYPPPHAQDIVKPILGNVSTERMRDDLVGFTAFLTRHSQTEVRMAHTRPFRTLIYVVQTGRESQLWLVDKITEVHLTFNRVTLYSFNLDCRHLQLKRTTGDDRGVCAQ